MIPVRGPHQSEALGGCLVCLCLRPALVWNFSDASQRNRRPILCGWQHFENATTNSAVWSASKNISPSGQQFCSSLDNDDI